ncbi:hypothetical protein HOC13_01865 [Candidatus Woesearchaeota archaeon]|jgi:hypothetical protein|nr:hypothetical protein [Candidatus Woesearchaeota archaeon]
MIKKVLDVREGVGSFPKQDLDSLVGSEKIKETPFSWGKELAYGEYNGCSITLCVPGNPHMKTQQIHISGEVKAVERVVEEFQERYSWAKNSSSVY